MKWLLTMMFGDCWVGWMYRADVDECPHQRDRLSRALVLSLERGLCSFSSVPVLMLIMPPIKIYIKSYNAAGSHASDQSPVRAEMAVKRDRKIIHTCHFLLDTGLISKVPTS